MSILFASDKNSFPCGLAASGRLVLWAGDPLCIGLWWLYRGIRDRGGIWGRDSKGKMWGNKEGKGRRLEGRLANG
jgi:hypothetical protein